MAKPEFRFKAPARQRWGDKVIFRVLDDVSNALLYLGNRGSDANTLRKPASIRIFDEYLLN